MDDLKEIINITLLGETNVGKTCLMDLFSGGDSTGGCWNKGEIIYKENLYKFAIWDTNGNERSRAVNKYYFKNANIILIVYSIDIKSSFNEVDFWINFVKENHEKNEYIIALIANKNDLYENQVVSKKEGEEIAKKYGISFLLTSAETNGKCFKDFVNKLIIKYINKDFLPLREVKIFKELDKYIDY